MTPDPVFIQPEPRRPLLNDALLSYMEITAPQIGVTVSPDRLGPVNRIVRLVRRHGDRDHVIKTVVTHIPRGAHVAVERDNGSPHITLWDDKFNLVRTLQHRRPNGWQVTVNGRTVLTASDADCQPPAPPPPPAPPWWVRARRATTRRARQVADRVAARLGYRPTDQEMLW